MLTAALLVGQCQMPVLANEGSAPTEADISDENKAGTQEGEAGVTDKDAPKESNTDQGGEEDGTGEGGSGETSSGNGSTDGTGEGDNGADNGGTDGAGEGDNGMDNGGTDDAGENVPGADDAGIGDEGADQGGEEGAPDKCVCGTACTEDAVNMDCPVCAADYAACAKNAGGGGKTF